MNVWEITRDICRSRALVYLVIYDAGHISILTVNATCALNVEWRGR